MCFFVALLSFAPIFHEDGPSFVIAPATADLQILSRETFFHKSRTFDQCDRRNITWLNVGFESMQFQIDKRMAQHQRDSFRHVTLPRELSTNLITEIRALKNT